MLKRTTLVKHVMLTKFYDWFACVSDRFLPLSLIFVLSATILTGCSLKEKGDSSDPVVIDSAIAFIKRPLISAEDGEVDIDNALEPAAFHPGAVLYIKDNASVSADAKVISDAAFSGSAFLNEDGNLLYDVKDLNISYDGTKLIFSMRAPEIEDADDEDQPTWNIWEYDLAADASDRLRRIIIDNENAEKGQDISPSYLPNGRILFTSTRQSRSKAILLDEQKSAVQFSYLDEERDVEVFVLHTMGSEGGDIKQITFNQSHDLNPLLLDNGKVLFSRWDNAPGTTNNGINLYQINPDGSQLSYMYGRHSHDSGEEDQEVHFLNPKEMDNGNIAVDLREFETGSFSSQPTEVNINDFVEVDVSIVGSFGEGQSGLADGVDSSDTQSLKGTYGSFFPLNDGTNRYLVSWSPCRVVEADAEGNSDGNPEFCTQSKLDSDDYIAASPLFNLWIYDADEDTKLPIDEAEEELVLGDAVIMSSRTAPDDLDPIANNLSVEDELLASEGYGIIHIKSVYDFDGIDTSPAGISTLADPALTAVSERPQRFIRFEKPVSMPSDEVRDFDNTAFGRSRNQLMREILGYAPIEPDGSVKVAVPAEVPFSISILNELGQRTSDRHNNWIHLAPGETLQCIGCHTDDSNVPHGRSDAEPDAVNTGAITSGIEFPNTDPALIAQMGETMAQTYTRINGVQRLTADILFDDVWTDPAASPVASLSYAYSELETTAPMNDSCAIEWTSSCRIIINYEANIHPLWSLDRRVFEDDEVTLVTDNTCTSCHNIVDSDNLIQLPEAQLDLSDGPSTDEPDHYKSYRELLFNDNEQELSNGALIDLLVDTGEIQMVGEVDEEGNPVLGEDGVQNQVPVLIDLLDDDGEQVLDVNGDPVQVTVPITALVNVSPSMNTNSAIRNNRFMSAMVNTVHNNILSAAEMKMISEWLDIGAQYFNNPFVAPAN